MSPVMSKLGPDPSSIQDLIIQRVSNINGTLWIIRYKYLLLYINTIHLLLDIKKMCNCEEGIRRSDSSSAVVQSR